MPPHFHSSLDWQDEGQDPPWCFGREGGDLEASGWVLAPGYLQFNVTFLATYVKTVFRSLMEDQKRQQEQCSKVSTEWLGCICLLSLRMQNEVLRCLSVSFLLTSMTLSSPAVLKLDTFLLGEQNLWSSNLLYWVKYSPRNIQASEF